MSTRAHHISAFCTAWIIALTVMPTALVPVSASTLADIDLTQPSSFSCLTSAYYSPLKTQKYFSTGDYWREIYLNGNGVSTADGTPAALGVLAAPPSIPFGTKIYIEGFGLGVVHDRGGAIRDNRIDIYMGAGDDGLARAVNWGKREKMCTVYPEGVALPDTIQATAGTYQLPVATMPNRVQLAMAENLETGSTGDKVKQVQDKLAELKFYTGESTGVFDSTLTEAVIAFQINRGIIGSPDEYGAGYVGPTTWHELFEEPRPAVTYAATTAQPTPIRSLTIGSSGTAVTQAQQKLKDLGLFDYPVITGSYGPVTRDAVGAFQLKYGVVTSTEDPNYGILGPKTLRILDKAARGEEITQADLIDIDFVMTLRRGMTNNEVTRIQQKLAKAGFFTYHEFTTLYGPMTEDAVYAFQVSQGLVRARTDVGAGVYGPITARALDIYINDRVYVNAELALFTNPYLIDYVALSDTRPSVTELSATENTAVIEPTVTETDARAPYVFERTLDYGSSGDDVIALQQLLGIAETGTYDIATKDAVCAYQIERAIVSSCTDPSAGVFGPFTREVVNEG